MEVAPQRKGFLWKKPLSKPLGRWSRAAKDECPDEPGIRVCSERLRVQAIVEADGFLALRR